MGLVEMSDPSLDLPLDEMIKLAKKEKKKEKPIPTKKKPTAPRKDNSKQPRQSPKKSPSKRQVQSNRKDKNLQNLRQKRTAKLEQKITVVRTTNSKPKPKEINRRNSASSLVISVPNPRAAVKAPKKQKLVQPYDTKVKNGKKGNTKKTEIVVKTGVSNKQRKSVNKSKAKPGT